jgi:hypothetical protein
VPRRSAWISVSLDSCESRTNVRSLLHGVSYIFDSGCSHESIRSALLPLSNPPRMRRSSRHLNWRSPIRLPTDARDSPPNQTCGNLQLLDPSANFPRPRTRFQMLDLTTWSISCEQDLLAAEVNNRVEPSPRPRHDTSVNL